MAEKLETLHFRNQRVMSKDRLGLRLYVRQHHWVNATPPAAADNTRRFCLKRGRHLAEMRASATRRWGLVSLVIVAAMLCKLKTAAATETATEQQLRRSIEDVDERESVGLRGLMPILDGTYSNITGDYDYHCTVQQIIIRYIEAGTEVWGGAGQTEATVATRMRRTARIVAAA